MNDAYALSIVRAYVFGQASITLGLPFLPMPVIPKHPYADCDGCPLYVGGSYVPSTFPIKARSTGNQVALVGEAPGENEVKQGKPFIGLSGKLLDGVLKIVEPHVHIEREAALVANAVSCHYHKEQFDKLPAAAVEHCRPRLLHELEQVGAQTAVTLGAHALHALIDTKEGITLARAGGPRPSTYVPGLLVVPTFHPAYVMRDHTKFSFLVSDLAKVSDDMWDTWKEVSYRVVSTEQDAANTIVQFWNQPVEPLCVDTESGADKDTTFGGAIKDLLCMGIWNQATEQVIVFPREVFTDETRRMMGKLFMRNGLDGQNLKYDICRVLNVFLGLDGLLDIQIKADRMLESYCLNENSGIHGLDYMSREYLGSPKWKHFIKDSMEEGRRQAKAEAKAKKENIGKRFDGLNYSFVDPDVLHKYNAYDVANTWRLKEHFVGELAAVDGLPKLYDHLLQVAQMLIHVEQRGMEIDLDYNAKLEIELRESLEQVDFGSGVGQFNPASPIQVKALLQASGVRVDDTRKDTLASLIDRYSLTSDRDDIVDFCKTLLSFRGDSKMLSTYVIGLRNTLVDGVAHPDFSMLSKTGRLKPRNPNSTNTPKGSKFRKQYVAREGKVFVHNDYKQAELRVMGWLAKDETLRKMFSSPGDIFENMCVQIWPAFMSWDSPARGKGRQGIKATAYGTAYGRTAGAIAKALRISKQEAFRLQQTFNAQIPDVVKYQQRIKEIVTNCEDLVTPFGRRRRFRLVTEYNIIDICNEAMAHMPQSTSADICLKAAIQLDKDGVPIVNLIHDAIMAEPDVKEADECARHITDVMVSVAEEITEGFLPWAVDSDKGKSFGDF